ncbi:MAG: hypothetical protein PCFJNLEI_02263 [Verrucomicrobiae bacterium]|nr:hypothetical protein [Verrucomicrobiae bacterium]
MKLLTAIFIWAGLSAGLWVGHAQEVALSAEEFAKLDTFEGHELAKADKLFAAKDFRSAAAAYEAFLVQYAKSSATAYAILRKGRCQQLGNKRFEAIKTYTEVLDYFPNAVQYAAAALYYIGVCHEANGHVEEALKSWTEMARDVDYQKHFLAAGALTSLADNLLKLGRISEAANFYEQAATNFRRANPEVYREAISKIMRIRIRLQPDQPKLREFYDKLDGFEGKGSDGDYWTRVRTSIQHQAGTFSEAEAKTRDTFYRYWADQMEGKFASWDDYQIDLAGFRRAYERDTGKWTERLDRQFRDHQKPDDFDRVIKWIQLFAGQKPKVQEYYGKLNFAKMNNAQLQRLMHILFQTVQDAGMAKNVFDKIRLDQMNDNEKANLARSVWNFGNDQMVEAPCQTMTDKNRGVMERLRYYEYKRNAGKGLPLADEATKIPAVAKEAYWLKANLLQNTGRFADAIPAYQAADNPPANLWRIVDCHLGLKKRDQALAQLREIENFFKDHAAEAALRIASLHRDDQKQYVRYLRGILKKYPKSSQSNTAHLELERLGVPIGGGVDAE